MNINWYPGHMLKTKREITEDLKLIDVVIEILDARAPASSQNPDIAKIVRNKKHIVLLNKSDLAESIQNDKWVQYFKSKGIVAIPVNCNLGKGIDTVIKQVQKEDEGNIRKGIINKRIRVMVVGIPNVGKSSFINRASNRKAAAVQNKPGVTKQKQWIRLSNNIELLDTPGVLWPKLEEGETQLNLSYIGTIKDNLLDKTEIAYNLLKYLLENYKQDLFERYKLTEEEIENILANNSETEDFTYNVMQLIARKRGAIVSGGNVDDEKIARIILTDFREGKLRQNYFRKKIKDMARWSSG